MSDNLQDSKNLATGNTPQKGSWPVIGTRAHPDDIMVIDRAALAVGMKRGPFMLRAALKEARAVEAAAGERRQRVRRKGDLAA